MVWHYYFTIALSGFINTLFAVLLYARRLPRRKYWGLWLALGVGLGIGALIGFSYVENALYDGRDESVNLLGVALQQILILAANISIVRLFTKVRADVLLMCCGVIAVAAHALLRFEFLLPAAGVLFGVGLGVMVYDMLPTMSDVWNGVHFIGGNLTAYIVYTAVSFAVAAAVICCCFIGTEKAE